MEEYILQLHFFRGERLPVKVNIGNGEFNNKLINPVQSGAEIKITRRGIYLF